MSETPNHLAEIEYRVGTDPTLSGQDFEGRDLENRQEQASAPPDTESNAVNDWDCFHTGHLPVFDRARYKQPSMAPVLWHAKTWQD
jgi:hypothetical protein